MTITDEELSAYLDGEVPPERAAELRAALQSDAELASRFASLRAADKLVQEAYDAIFEEPVPPDVLELLEPARTRRRSPFARVRETARGVRAASVGWATGLATAAALVVGVGLGVFLSPNETPAPTRPVLLAGPIDP
ncbi:MAG: zf-HC2 domain-containing protein, partial [Caulobacterales bacterium]|nr:zf-HC2 domain-containing protein [Caulobacterales bacterium]